MPVAGPAAAKVEKAGRDRLTSERLAFDQAEIFVEIILSVAALKRALGSTLFKRLSAC